MMLSKEEFFEKYNISSDEFEKVSLEWDLLTEIFNDYKIYRKTLFPTAETIANILRNHPDVHSVRTRIKDSEHLIDKIIRKTIKIKKKEPARDYVITIENYKYEITDLIGIRVLHLYKEQAINIDNFIRDHWNLQETATIYYRDGDYSKEEIESKKGNESFYYEVHPAGYRSWHYLISAQITRVPHISEIQVRTIFEEGWSEIDHQLRYPNDVNNILLTEQLLVLNRIAGSADEMANTIRETKKNINSLILQNIERQKSIEELNEQLDTLLKENKIKDADKKALEEKVKELQQSKYTSDGLLGNIIVTGGDTLKSSLFNYDIDPLKTIDVKSIELDYTNHLLSDRLIVKPHQDFLNGIYSDRKHLDGYTDPTLKKKDE